MHTMNLPEEHIDDLDVRNLDSFLVELHRGNAFTESIIGQAGMYAKSMSKTICSSFVNLNDMVVRYEPLIRKRWLKKSVAQRRDVLTTAWPDIAVEHRSDVARYCEYEMYRAGLGPAPARPGTSIAFSFINLDELTKPKSLLIYVNSRARNLPWTFAAGELEYSEFGIICSHGKPWRWAATVYFVPDTDPEIYGQVRNNISCCGEKDEHLSLDLLEGLQVLKAQARIMSFLSECCRIILHDIRDDELKDAPIVEEPPASELHLSAEHGHTSFSDTLAIAPYLQRESLELPRLQIYVHAMYSEFKDHVFALREDPSYFTDRILDALEHRSEMIPDIGGFIDPVVDTPSFLRSTLIDLVANTNESLLMWHELSTKLDMLVAHSQDQLSLEKLQEILDFEALIDRAQSRLLDSVAHAGSAAPTMREYFMRTHTGLHTKGIHLQPLGSKHVSLEKFLILGIIEEIMSFNRSDYHRKPKGFHALPTRKNDVDFFIYFIMDRLNTLARKHKSARDMLTARLWSLVSQLSIIVECRHQIFMFKKSNEIFGMMCVTDIHSEVPTRGDFSFGWAHHIKGCTVPTRLIDPTRGKLRYPVDKARTAQTVKTMRAAEANLDSFWKCIDDFYLCKTGTAQHDVLRECLLEGGELRRTAPWNGAVIKAQVKNDGVYQPFSTAKTQDASVQITGQFDRKAVCEKVKNKTRSRAHASSGALDEAEHDNEVTSPESFEEAIKVDKRSLQVFRALFRAPTAEMGEVSKAIKWHEYKRAMVRAGFFAEKLQGSAWQFVPSDKIRVGRSIQFHEPHPDSDIPYHMARHFGRRLERVYGWCASTFKLA